MWRAEASTDIAAPVDSVYDLLADFRRHSEWSRGVSEVEHHAGPETGVGAEFKTLETVPSKFVSFARITALEPATAIAWEARDDGGMMKVDWSFELTPTEAGTRLTQRCVFQPQNLMGSLVLNIMRRWQIPGENRASLARIKEIMEGSAPPAE